MLWRHFTKEHKGDNRPSDILQGQLSIQHILPYLLDKCICIGKLFFPTQMPYKRDLHFLAVESLVEIKKVYFY